MKKYRVFITCIGWSDVMFIFDEEIKFSEIKNNTQTHMLTKEDYIGIYEFDKNFINNFNSNKIFNKIYFYKFSYHKDSTTNEEKKWINTPVFEQNIKEEHKDVEIKTGQISNNIDSLFD